MVLIHTGNKELDYLLDGGIPPGRIIEFCGPTCTGKTQIIHQIIVNSYFQEDKDGLNGIILHIDTNGDFSSERIIQLCKSKRLNHKAIFDKIILFRLLNEARLLDLFDIICDIIQNQQIKIFTIDSLTWPLIKMMYEKKVDKHSLIKLYNNIFDLIEQFPSLIVVYTSPYIPRNYIPKFMTHKNITRIELQNIEGHHKRAELLQPQTNFKHVDFYITKKGISNQ
ncbi:MAG: hypothetical protein ACFFC3_05550 [Candidatus Odinarchaeota archaeon]